MSPAHGKATVLVSSLQLSYLRNLYKTGPPQRSIICGAREAPYHLTGGMGVSAIVLSGKMPMFQQMTPPHAPASSPYETQKQQEQNSEMLTLRGSFGKEKFLCGGKGEKVENNPNVGIPKVFKVYLILRKGGWGGVGGNRY